MNLKTILLVAITLTDYAVYLRSQVIGSVGDTLSDLKGATNIVVLEEHAPGTPYLGRVAYLVKTNELGEVSFITNAAYVPSTPLDHQIRKQMLLRPQVDFSEDGCLVSGGGHSVFFKGNLNYADGSVEIRFPGNRMLRSRPLALALSDNRGKRLWIGLVRKRGQTKTGSKRGQTRL